MQFANLLLPLALSTGAAYCATIQGQIKFPDNLLVASKDIERTTIEIQQVGSPSPRQSSLIDRNTYLQADSGFQFNNIQDGDYLLSLDSIDFNFTPSKVKISVRDDQVLAFIYEPGSNFEASTRRKLSHPIQFHTLEGNGKRVYVKPSNRGILDVEPIKTIVNSPLYMTLLLAVVVLYMIPLIWEMIDPEVAAVAKKQKESKKPIMAEGTEDKEETSSDSKSETVEKEKEEIIEEEVKQKETSEKKRTSKNKKRKN